MEIKNLLSEFEYDWAAFSAVSENFPKNEIKNKSVLIVGGHSNFARAILYSILAANDLKNTGISVSFLAEEEYIDNIPDGIIGRPDFRYYNFGTAPEKLPRTDIVISTGVCNMALKQTPEFFSDSVQRMKYALETADKTGAQHFILFSDYRAYGKTERSVIVSENENGYVNFSRASGISTMLLQTLEAQTAAFAKQRDFDFTILRCAIMLGAGAELDDSIISDMLKAVAVGDEYSIINSNNKYSFVYLSDVLNAMFYAAASMRRNTTYNVVGKDSTVSTGMLAAMLHDLYPDKAKITLEPSEKDPSYGVSMNNQKISVFGGCKPAITLEQAVQLVVKSYLHERKIFVFDNSCQGKLKSVQNIMLLYLLEIDRICRKHHIKYFLAGGTLLGAIRHKGFIPWDDDADVMMLREDYEKFLRVVQSELPPNVRLSTVDTDPNTHNIFAKLRIDNTIVATNWTSEFPNMHNGISFDIMAHDNTANSKLGRKIHLQLTILARSLVFNKWHNRKIDNGHKFQSAVSNIIKKILPLSVSEKLQFKCMRWFENKKDAKYLYDGMGRNIYRGDFPKKWLNETVYWDFEGYKFPVPKEYDKYLRYLYGDYENLVLPCERQESHDIAVMDLEGFASVQLPEHTYHNISVAQPISDYDLPKKYPKRSKAKPKVQNTDGAVKNEADKEQNDDDITTEQNTENDVKIFAPKTKNSKEKDKKQNKTSAETEDKAEDENSKQPKESEPDKAENSDKNGDSEKSEQDKAADKPEGEEAEKAEKAARLDETIEFSIRETDISKYSSSEAKKRLADTREFSLNDKGDAPQS